MAIVGHGIGLDDVARGQIRMNLEDIGDDAARPDEIAAGDVRCGQPWPVALFRHVQVPAFREGGERVRGSPGHQADDAQNDQRKGKDVELYLDGLQDLIIGVVDAPDGEQGADINHPGAA